MEKNRWEIDGPGRAYAARRVSIETLKWEFSKEQWKKNKKYERESVVPGWTRPQAGALTEQALTYGTFGNRDLGGKIVQLGSKNFGIMLDALIQILHLLKQGRLLMWG